MPRTGFEPATYYLEGSRSIQTELPRQQTSQKGSEGWISRPRDYAKDNLFFQSRAWCRVELPRHIIN